MRIVLCVLLVLSLCGCKSETKEEKAPAPTAAPAPAPAPVPEEKPIITEETKAEDANVKAEVETICKTLNTCWAAEKAGNQCDASGVLKEMILKTPYASGLRDRLVSSNLAKKTLEELKQNAQGLGAKCDLEK